MVAICVVCIILLILGEILFRKYKESKLIALLQTNVEKFDLEIEKASTKMAIPTYNLEYLRLNRYLITNDKHHIDYQFDSLFRMKKTKVQSKDIFLKAFCYYLEIGDFKKCHQCAKEIYKMDDQNLIEMVSLISDVYIDKNKKRVGDIQKKIEFAPPQDRYLYEHLLKVIQS